MCVRACVACVRACVCVKAWVGGGERGQIYIISRELLPLADVSNNIRIND